MTITETEGPMPDPWELVEGTDWTSLEHACGSAEGALPVLGGLLAADPSTQARAMRYLEDPVHHQNTIYSATVPAALYVAAALQDPRTATVLPSRERGKYPLRAAMLDWMESVANAVGNDAEAIRERLGFSLERDPASVQVRALRPTLFRAVSPLLHDPDPAVREAAIAAAVSLLDASELVQHRATLVPLVAKCWPPVPSGRIATSQPAACGPGEKTRDPCWPRRTRTRGPAAAVANRRSDTTGPPRPPLLARHRTVASG